MYTYIQYPLSQTQSQYTSYAPQYATHKPVTPATAHSGTHKPKCGAAPATAHSGTYIHTNPSVEQLQQQLTQAHIYTQTLSVGASSNSSLRYIYTHKPKCGAAPATAHSGTYIHTNPSVEQLQQQLTQAHIYTQTLSVGASSNSSLRYIYTCKPKRGTAPATAHSGTHKHINR